MALQGGPSSILGQGTTSHMPQLRACMLQLRTGVARYIKIYKEPMAQAPGWEHVILTGVLQDPCPSGTDTDCGSCLQDGLGAAVGVGAL